MGGKKISALTESTTVPSNSYTIIVDGTVNKKIKLETITKSLSDRVNEVNTQLNTTTNNLSDRLTDLESELNVNTNKVNTQETTISNLSNKVNTQETTINNLSNRIDNINPPETTINNLSNRIDAQGTAINNLSNRIDTQETTTNNLSDKVTDLENELSVNTNKVNKQDTTIRSLSNKINAQDTTISNLSNKVNTQETTINNLSNGIDAQETMINNLSNKANTQETTINNLSNRIDTQDTTISNLSNKVDTQDTTISNLSNKVNTQGVTISSLSNRVNGVSEQLDNNTIEINNLKNTKVENKNVQGYKITDPLINSYSQELTLTNGFVHYNIDLYGKLYLNVDGELFIVNGVVNKNMGNPSDFSLTLHTVELKQKTSKLFNTVAYDSTFTKCNNNALFLNKDGSIGIDSSIFNLDSSCNLYMNININGQLVREYVSADNISMVTHLINRAKSKINKDSSIIVHAPDTHIRPLEDESTSSIDSYNVYAPKVINYINKNIGAFATICNGDAMTESNSVKTKDLLKLQGTKIRRMYNENTVFVLGNHDDGSLLEDSEFLTKEEFNEVFNFGKLGIVNSYGLQPYFYTDDIIGRCRHIFLNTHDGEGRKIGLFNIGVNQIKWLIDILNNTGSMSICIWCHTPLCDNVTNNVQNVEIIRNILSAYKQRNKIAISLNDETINIDFSKSVGLIAGVISGHEHKDYNQVIGGINYIMDKDFYTGLSASVYIIDHTFRKLNVMRMGENRTDLILDY